MPNTRPFPKARLRTILERALDSGIRFGLQRYNKYTDTPLSDAAYVSLVEHLDREIMLALDEAFDIP